MVTTPGFRLGRAGRAGVLAGHLDAWDAPLPCHTAKKERPAGSCWQRAGAPASSIDNARPDELQAVEEPGDLLAGAGNCRGGGLRVQLLHLLTASGPRSSVAEVGPQRAAAGQRDRAAVGPLKRDGAMAAGHLT